MEIICSGFKLNRFPEDPNYERYTLENFNAIFAFTQNSWISPSTYDFTELENILAWSQIHQKTVIMDGVIWPCRVPEWLAQTHFSTAYFKKIVQDYVSRIIKFPFFSYDLLSELFNYQGNHTGNFWHNKLGDNYLMDILEVTQAHKGESKMVYSDFGYKLTEKWNGIVRFLKSIKNKNLIDAVSIQVHINVVPGFHRHILIDRIKQIQDLGYTVFMPEIVCWGNIYLPIGGDLLQRRIYLEIIDICHNCKIPVYGFGSCFDAHPWIQSPYNCTPGLWDENYKAKVFTQDIFDKINALVG